ncbi:MAG: hypothetical protein ACJAW2_001274, partial [Shewanella sp.]
MEGNMLNELNPFQFISLLLSLLTSVTLFIAYSTSRKHKELRSEIERKEKALESKSVDEIVRELQQTFQEIEQKLFAGKPLFDKLTETLNHNADQLKYIDVGLLPPTFKFDERESLKEQ